MKARLVIVALALLSLTTSGAFAELCSKQIVDNPDEVRAFEQGEMKYELEFSHNETLDDGSCKSHLVAIPTR